jgi:hypothetical protein
MMGRHQGQLFYSFDLDAAVPGDHLVREIAAVVGLTNRSGLAQRMRLSGKHPQDCPR